MLRSPQRSTGAWLSAPWVLVLAALALAGCGATEVTGPPDPGSATFPDGYAVEYDSLFGTPRWVRSIQSLGPPTPGSPAPFSNAEAFQIVQGFVRQYAAAFHLRPGIDSFESVWAQGHDGLNFVKIRQTYRGIPVDVMGYGTMVLPGGTVGSMIGRFMPDISVGTIPGVPAEIATRNAIAAMTPIEVTPLSNPTLMILTDDFHPRLTWSVIVVRGYLSWTAIVDARDGTVIRTFKNWIEG